MTLLYPQFLFALLALSIPVIIHLFNFQKPKKVHFTNVRFLKEVKEQTKSNLKLKHLLILIARLLFLAFLVFAFTQPVIRKGDAPVGQGRKEVSIYLDNSYSMQGGNETGSLLDVGAAMLEDIVNVFPGNSQFYLLTNDFDGKSQYLLNKERVKEAVTEVKFSNTFRNGKTILERQQSALKMSEGKGGEDLFWLSDFQKSTIGDLSQLEVDSTQTLHLVPLQREAAENLYIDSIWLNSPFFKSTANNALQVRVINSGEEEKNTVLKLFVEDVQVSTASVTIPAKSGSNASFTFSITANNINKCRISIEDYPVTFDNTYYFVLKNAPEIRILHVWQKETPYIQNVFSNKNYFTLNSYNYKNIDFSQFEKADLVVMDGVDVMDVALIEATRKAMKSGASIAFFPSEKPEVTSYSSFLLTAGVGNVQAVKQDTSSSSANLVAMPDMKNPFFTGIYEDISQGNITLPYANNVISWPASGNKLLTYKRGAPFLSQFKKGESQLYLFASPLNDQFTNFHTHGSFFVPIMYKMAMLSVNENERLGYTFQDPAINVLIGEGSRDNVYKLVKEKQEIIPEQRQVDSRLILQLPKVEMEPGYYHLMLNDKKITTLAFNYGKEESEVAFYTQDELKQLFSGRANIKIYESGNKNAFISDFTAQTIGTPLWKWALLIALLFLLAEVLLIRFWKA